MRGETPSEDQGRGRGRHRNSIEIGLKGAGRLERSDRVPLYYQLGEILKQRLESGAWPPDTLFPPERELEEHFGVSRAVVRPALELLERDGAIYRRRGSGTYVAQPKRSVQMKSLLGRLRDGPDGLSILQLRESYRDETTAAALGLGDDQPVARVTALLTLDLPVCIVDSSFAPGSMPWVLAAARSLGAGEMPVRREWPRPTRVEGILEGSSCGPWTASRLGVRTGDPALVGRLVQFGTPARGRRERPLELTRIVARSDVAEFRFSDRGGER